MNETCAVCVYAKMLTDDDHVLCEKKGLMPKDARCRKQQTDLTKIHIRRKRTIAPMSVQKNQTDTSV